MIWVKGNKNSIDDLILALSLEDSLETQSKIFDAFCVAFGIDSQVPKVESTSNYRRSNDLVLYRAYDAKIKDFIKFKKEFVQGKFQRYSRSVLGNGLCFADKKSFAKYYSDLKGKIFGMNMIKCKLDRNANLATRSNLEKDFQSLKNEVVKNIQSFLQCDEQSAERLYEVASLEDNHMMRGVLLGYDGLFTQTSDKDNVFVIFNRSCLTCSKSSVIGLRKLKPFKEKGKINSAEVEVGVEFENSL